MIFSLGGNVFKVSLTVAGVPNPSKGLFLFSVEENRQWLLSQTVLKIQYLDL